MRRTLSVWPRALLSKVIEQYANRSHVGRYGRLGMVMKRSEHAGSLLSEAVDVAEERLCDPSLQK
jgi:hypothetical protein